MRIDWAEEGDPRLEEAIRLRGGKKPLAGIMRTMTLQPEYMAAISEAAQKAHFTDGYLKRRTKEMIATTGRVKVRVDATKHPVKAGDLLVTSSKPGTAMLSVPVKVGDVEMHRPGTLIGKALEPLASGEGEILVLLSLQ